MTRTFHTDVVVPRSPSVLVTGASGNLGREVVDRLRARGIRVRGFDRAARATPADRDWVSGDLTDPGAVAAALSGIDTVLLLWPLLDAAPARPVIERLAAAAVRVVYVSSIAVDDAENPDAVARVHGPSRTSPAYPSSPEPVAQVHDPSETAPAYSSHPDPVAPVPGPSETAPAQPLHPDPIARMHGPSKTSPAYPSRPDPVAQVPGPSETSPAHPSHPDPIARVHAEMEAALWDAGLRPTVLRSDTMASNARGWIGQLRAGDVVSGPDIAATAVVDERDVAEAAVAVLLAPDERFGPGPHLLTGPEALSRADQVARLGVALGRRLRFEATPLDVARRRLLADGRPAALVDALLAVAAHRPESRRVTDTVERLTGRPAGSFQRWAAEHADEFGAEPVS